MQSIGELLHLLPTLCILSPDEFDDTCCQRQTNKNVSDGYQHVGSLSCDRKWFQNTYSIRSYSLTLEEFRIINNQSKILVYHCSSVENWLSFNSISRLVMIFQMFSSKKLTLYDKNINYFICIVSPCPSNQPSSIFSRKLVRPSGTTNICSPLANIIGLLHSSFFQDSEAQK